MKMYIMSAPPPPEDHRCSKYADYLSHYKIPSLQFVCEQRGYIQALARGIDAIWASSRENLSGGLVCYSLIIKYQILA